MQTIFNYFTMYTIFFYVEKLGNIIIIIIIVVMNDDDNYFLLSENEAETNVRNEAPSFNPVSDFTF